MALGTDHGFFQPDGTPLTDAELPHVRALAGEDAAPMDKRIVARHGGTIEATANPYGNGTRMSFTMPAGRSAYARTLAPAR